ncbi:alanine--glyoxylate aminotransferase family protein [Pikeienuella piscinae]|uniref:Alanine--glyoxylate aminotransferase family protein n=1 Tax=Pikeienuella piscinae TaxID=2748098 RepID=A0A7L5BY74_9RHOB|nr:aminotransferase class V-fold PLP-dependent enzyme [Pikeienuella piscinae]QIE55186.1 alanine--glyoxylate aminotransferase family protein [Pikeienuella piscinae]
MTALLSDIDPDGLLEYSVVFTDRSLNHMSAAFQTVMRDISSTLKSVYAADHVAIVPGGGTYAMESVARMFVEGEEALVVRNGLFSYRWTQIFEAGGVVAGHEVMKARRVGNAPDAPFAPTPVDEVVAKIRETRPAAVFAPHVETASGMILPDDYVASIATATREVGGLFVLDCVASGCIWVDMKALGVDVLISAPQKGWSSSPSAGLVMMSTRAREEMKGRSSSSFALDLTIWTKIMEVYETGGHAYHATMPTDALRRFRDAMKEAEAEGFDKLKTAQQELGRRVRASFAAHGLKSVAAEGFEAPGVVVAFTSDPDVKSGAKFAKHGYQVAAGVPLMVDEGPDYASFRVGLFGLDKLRDVDGAVARLDSALDKVF